MLVWGFQRAAVDRLARRQAVMADVDIVKFCLVRDLDAQDGLTVVETARHALDMVDGRIRLAFSDAINIVRRKFDPPVVRGGLGDYDLSVGVSLDDREKAADDADLLNALKIAEISIRKGRGDFVTVFAKEKPRSLTTKLVLQGSVADAREGAVRLETTLRAGSGGAGLGDEEDAEEDAEEESGGESSDDELDEAETNFRRRARMLEGQAKAAYGYKKTWTGKNFEDTETLAVDVVDGTGTRATTTTRAASASGSERLFARCNMCHNFGKVYEITGSVKACIDYHMKRKHPTNCDCGKTTDSAEKKQRESMTELLASTVVAATPSPVARTPRNDSYEIVLTKVDGSRMTVWDSEKDEQAKFPYSAARSEFGRLRLTMQAGETLEIFENDDEEPKLQKKKDGPRQASPEVPKKKRGPPKHQRKKKHGGPTKKRKAST